MSERTMSNVREKLSMSREKCPGLSEEVYALADYMAKIANDTLEPWGMVMYLALSIGDILRGENGFASGESKEIPECLSKHKTQVWTQAVYIPQIIDAIADKDFAEEFRKICKDDLNFDPPKRDRKYDQNADIVGDYPEYVKVAANWWANIIVNPKFDNGDDSNADGMAFLLTMMVNSKSSISKEQIDIFRKELADIIVEQMKSSRNGECNLDVDYEPDMLLHEAAHKAGIDDMGFPWKTSMVISKDKVSVSVGYAADWKTLWRKAYNYRR